MAISEVEDLGTQLFMPQFLLSFNDKSKCWTEDAAWLQEAHLPARDAGFHAWYPGDGGGTGTMVTMRKVSIATRAQL